jgi:hypothetical protein
LGSVDEPIHCRAVAIRRVGSDSTENVKMGFCPSLRSQASSAMSPSGLV